MMTRRSKLASERKEVDYLYAEAGGVFDRGTKKKKGLDIHLEVVHAEKDLIHRATRLSYFKLTL
ncbi:hypothetical protein [Ornithinibacillus contaminans]|uniref:hypothetical protein n=1 Tax=Ornithinibacillus contaminans TaxID=694055 RepID=UPI00064DDBC0|nr:hypothetical protein [Ornithinibacillus contaminans]